MTAREQIRKLRAELKSARAMLRAARAERNAARAALARRNLDDTLSTVEKLLLRRDRRLR